MNKEMNDLQPYLEMIDFNVVDAKATSSAAAGLSSSAIHRIEFHRVEKIGSPKEQTADSVLTQQIKAHSEVQLIHDNSQGNKECWVNSKRNIKKLCLNRAIKAKSRSNTEKTSWKSIFNRYTSRRKSSME
jgi:hypothetical protein